MSLSYAQIPAALAARKAFTGNSLSAKVTDYPGTGILPDVYADLVRDHARQAVARGVSMYVLYSYSTPIAWVATDSHAVYVPEVYYSRTTSRGQGIARRWALDESHLIASAS